MAKVAIFDVDGTLVDTNYQHALAWFYAFRRFGITRPVWRIHRAIGMGGDKLVPAIGGTEVEGRFGDALREAWSQEFDKVMGSVQPFAGARDLLTEIKRRGFILVLASSGHKRHVEPLLDLIDGRSIADDWTTAEDADRSKPDPDLVATALAKVNGDTGVMVGDSTWDAIAAKKLGIPTIAVRTGGFSGEELRDAGAAQVFESLLELRCDLDRTALARPE